MIRKKLCITVTKLAIYCLMLSILLCSCADLVTRNVHYEPLTGPNLVMKGTVGNQGLKTAGESITKLERRNSLNDPFIETARITTPPLGPGESKELFLWIFPPTFLPEPGNCLYVRVCADADNTINEVFESNNCLTRSFMNRQYCHSCDLCCNETLPHDFDWRNSNGTNWVTGVRDQGNCGSCWAFSAVAAVEAKNNVERDVSQLNPIDLSEQQLVSCPGGGGSCLGGWPHSALNYIRTNGIVDENTLPYTSTDCVTGSGTNLSCKSSCSSATMAGCANPLLTTAQCAILDKPAVPFGSIPPLWSIGSFHWVAGANIEDVKRALLCHGPLSVVSNNWRHAILLVGWDDNAVLLGGSTGAWIIKNSWGTGWGNNGYGLIAFSGHPYSDIINYACYPQALIRRH